MELQVDSGIAGMLFIMPPSGAGMRPGRSGLSPGDSVVMGGRQVNIRMKPVPVTLTASQRRALSKRARGARTEWRDRLRAQIVLLAARGWPNARIAGRLEVTGDTVRKWRGRFAGRGLDGLRDLARSGRPPSISTADRAAIVALACQLPLKSGVPLSRWSGPELKRELTSGGRAGEHVDRRPPGHRDLGREVGGPAEAPQAKRPARRNLRQLQRPVANDPGAQQRRQFSVAEPGRQ